MHSVSATRWQHTTQMNMRRLRSCTRNAKPWLLSFVILIFLIALDEFATDRLDSATTKVTRLFTAQNRNQSTTSSSSFSTTTEKTNATAHLLGLLRIPDQFLDIYIQQHSHASLMREVLSNDDRSPSSNRRFAVAYYWCPQRAGNILNSMFNTIVWAMIHNRTVLWKYHGTVDQHAECQKVLRLADWMPSFDEWQQTPTSSWNLSDPVPVPIDATSWERNHFSHQVVLYPQIPDVLVGDKSITRNAWSDHPMKTKPYQKYLQALPESFQSRAADLYRLGKSFLFGMLYTRLFELQRDPNTHVEFPTDTGVTQTDQDSTANVYYSIGLHSRHTVAADDGSWVPHEIKCLEHLLSVFEARFRWTRSCHIYLMSDRPKTIATLTEWSRNKNCSVITANHHVGGDCIKEHGPWAGAGYLEDLDVVAHATHALVGDPRRSSTSLLLDVMEYRKYLARDEDIGQRRTERKMEICKLPDKPPSGYDYGPDTPTFRYHPFLEPLPPVRVIRSYIESEGPPRRGAVWVEMNMDRVGNVYRILNAFLLAILYDLDLRWTSPLSSRPESCNEGVSLIIQLLASNLTHSDRFEKTNGTVDGILIRSYDGNVNFELSPGGTDASRYHSSEFPIWKELGDISQIEARAADLFAFGQDVAYGLLFNELFSFCPYPSPDPPTNVIPGRSVILEVSSGTAPADLPRIQSCIEMALKEGGSEESLGAAGYPRCHIYVLSDQPVVENTAPSTVLIPEQGLSSDLSPIKMELEHDCSLSIVYLPPVEHESTNAGATELEELGLLSPRIWNDIRTASHARSGWIAPNTVARNNNKTLHDGLRSSSLLIRERLEAKRHMEQWKAGREPFVISPFPECRY